VVAPPALFSTTIDWPSCCASAATKVRVTTSVPEPASSGTMTWIVLSCALALPAIVRQNHNAAAGAMDSPLFKWISL